MGMVIRPGRPTWQNHFWYDSFDDNGITGGPRLGNYYDLIGSRGVLPFQALNQLVSGDVNTNNVRNYGYAYYNNNYRLRTDKFRLSMTIGDTVNSGLETRLFVGRKTSGNSTAQPPTVRMTYLDVVSGNSYIRSTTNTGTQTSVTLSKTSPVGTEWWLECNGGANYSIYRDYTLVRTWTDPNGPMPLDNSVYVGVCICSDRNAFGTRNWGSRINDFQFLENGPPS